MYYACSITPKYSSILCPLLFIEENKGLTLTSFLTSRFVISQRSVSLSGIQRRRSFRFQVGLFGPLGSGVDGLIHLRHAISLGYCNEKRASDSMYQLEHNHKQCIILYSLIGQNRACKRQSCFLRTLILCTQKCTIIFHAIIVTIFQNFY